MVVIFRKRVNKGMGREPLLHFDMHYILEECLLFKMKRSIFYKDEEKLCSETK
jgi:hypothetical protein